MRAIIIRGVGVSSFWDQALYLILFTTVIILLANIIYKRKESRS
jgi:hypothetical protein